MTPATLLIPVILGAALVYAALTGHLTQEQLAAGGLLLLVPGADRYAPLLRQLLRLPASAPAAEPLPQVDIEDALEHAFWVYDQEHKRSGEERLLWKGYMRAAFNGQIGLPPTVRSVPPTPPSLPPAALAFLVPFLLLAPSCASWPAWRSALAACGVQVAPAGVQSGVALALHKGEGWAEALGELVSTYGGCLVKAQVQAHADGAGSDPPRAQAETAPLATLIGGGELAAGPSAVTRAEAQQRAAAWLRGHR